MPRLKHPAAYPSEFLSACHAALAHGELRIAVDNSDSKGPGRALNMRRQMYAWVQSLRMNPAEAPPGALGIADQCEFAVIGSTLIIRKRDNNPIAVAIRSAIQALPDTPDSPTSITSPTEADESAERLSALLRGDEQQ